MTTPHAAGGSNAQTRGILQIADLTEQRANEQRNKLQKQSTWRGAYSPKQDGIEFHQSDENFNEFYFILFY